MTEKKNQVSLRVGEMDFPPRKVWLKTFGCQMNYHDSERILSHLADLNFTVTEKKGEADLLLFNTCAIRDLANTKFYSQLGAIKHIKNNKNEVIIGVGGCVGQTEGKELIKKYKHLDFAFGTDVIDQINDMVYRTYAGENKFSINSWDRSSNYSIETKITHGSPQAFVNIIKGCDKFCSYCIVPFTRGREKSRKLDEVVKDVQNLVKYQGIQEVTLLGQNVNSYGKENNETLSELIIELEKIAGLEIIRYTTSHPYDISEDLIAVHGKSKKLANHLHLPVQSGSNSVLSRMKREYTREHILELMAKLRVINPEIVITTDIIVGFPNETDEEFEDTINLLNEGQFDFIYSFAFSPRAGTKAARMKDELSDDVRGARLRRMQLMQMDIQKNIRKDMIGKTYRILVEGDGDRRGIKKWKGRTSCNRIIHFVAENPEIDYKWHWVDIEVLSSTALSSQGKFLKDHGRRILP